MEELFTFSSMAALATLALLEIVLGIDNVVFLAILAGKLPEAQQARARTLGLMLAAVGRIILLFAISWVITLDQTKLFELPFAMPGSHEAQQTEYASAEARAPVDDTEPAGEANESTPISAKDIVLLIGGLFLV